MSIGTNRTNGIGKIIKSNSHIDYVCQVHGRGEVAEPPTPEEYALGSWVAFEAGSAPGSRAVGLVYDTQLYNPDYGLFGPRLSSRSQLEVFSPDYLNETAMLLGIVVVGQLTAGVRTAGGLCPVAAQVGAVVERIGPAEIRAFHSNGSKLEMSYYNLLLSLGEPILPPLVLHVLGGLEEILPEHARALNALRTTLSWKTRVDSVR
ncbi:MAG: hypothetical protein WKH64_15805 [Chloroflexia bacterium]